jgi:hypothetical protein
MRRPNAAAVGAFLTIAFALGAVAILILNLFHRSGLAALAR